MHISLTGHDQLLGWIDHELNIAAHGCGGVALLVLTPEGPRSGTRCIAEQLRRAARSTDTLADLGDDGVALLQPGTDNADEARAAAHRMAALFAPAGATPTRPVCGPVRFGLAFRRPRGVTDGAAATSLLAEALAARQPLVSTGAA